MSIHQAVVTSLGGELASCGEPMIERPGTQAARGQICSVPLHFGLAERAAGVLAVPREELIERSGVK